MKKETYKYQYEKWHQDTDESKSSDIGASVDFIDMHGLWPDKKKSVIFDVGCGMGRFLLAYRNKGYKDLSGIDVDDYQVGIAKKEALDVEVMDATEFFARNKKRHDLITMIDCLEHIEKEEQVTLLKNIDKGLNDDGMLVIRVPNALAPAFGYFRYDDFTHKVSYTTTSLRYLLKNSGFDYIAFRPAWRENEDIIRLKRPYADLLKAEFGLSEPILTSNLVAVAFKSQRAFDKYEKNAPQLTVKY
jgi:2-polyprenyl-3-methyl-5-hydroxy-6-metoxy-1,4-benzoquinol methylase